MDEFEFGKFAGGLEKTQKKVNEASKELDTLVGTRTRAMQKKLSTIQDIDQNEAIEILGYGIDIKKAKKYLEIHPEVQKALEEGKPVVALESTIISHGMPYPKNIEMAQNVSRIVRENGAIPATIAIINGVLKVGLTKEEIEFLGTSKDVVKASRRDLPFVISKKLNGATTVATTMILADLAGVKVFATGGIGGVHRGAQETFDISADLQELAHTNVTVVCAGAKAILDLPLTLEYLETMGVPVLGFQTEELPDFYTRHSGLKVDYRIDSYDEAAEIIKEKRQNKLSK